MAQVRKQQQQIEKLAHIVGDQLHHIHALSEALTEMVSAGEGRGRDSARGEWMWSSRCCH